MSTLQTALEQVGYKRTANQMKAHNRQYFGTTTEKVIDGLLQQMTRPRV